MVVSNNEVRVWADSYFGLKGNAAWIVPVGALAALYQIILMLKILLNRDNTFTINIIFIFALLGLISLFVIALLFFIQAIRTVQHIEIDKNTMHSHARLYYGRKINFYLNEIVNIAPYKMKIFRRLITPLGRGGNNYKITLKQGGSFFISGSMADVIKLIDLLQSVRTLQTESGTN